MMLELISPQHKLVKNKQAFASKSTFQLSSQIFKPPALGWIHHTCADVAYIFSFAAKTWELEERGRDFKHVLQTDNKYMGQFFRRGRTWFAIGEFLGKYTLRPVTCNGSRKFAGIFLSNSLGPKKFEKLKPWLPWMLQKVARLNSYNILQILPWRWQEVMYTVTRMHPFSLAL